MERRDYFMDQIEQMGKVLGMILSRIMGLKAKSNSEEIINYAVKSLHEKVDMDIKTIALCPDDLFKEKYLTKKFLNNEGMENLANILFELGKEMNTIAERNKFLTKSLYFYQHLIDHSQTFSLIWYDKISSIKKELNSSKKNNK